MKAALAKVLAPFDFAPLARRYACPELNEGLRANG